MSATPSSFRREVLVYSIGHFEVQPVLPTSPNDPVPIAGVKMHSLGKRILEALDATEWTALAPPAGPDGLIALGGPDTLGLGPSELAASLDLTTPQENAWRDAPAGLTRFFLPNLPPVLQRWIDNTPGEPERHLAFVYSAPTDNAERGRGTEKIAQVLRRWTERRYPSIHIASLPGLDGNPFVFPTLAPYLRGQLLPLLEDLRRDVVATGRGDWAKRFRVTVSLNTGTVPVLSGVYAALRQFRPQHLFIPDARARVGLDRKRGVEAFDYRLAEQAPAVPSELLADERLRELVGEMHAWRDAYRRVRTEPDGSELDAFWIRKGRQPVLAVLLIEDDAGRRTFHRACNLEVSLPTGSLCAERNAIGSALSADPALRRHHIRAVAVLSLPGEQSHDHNPLGPCGACREWLLKIAEVNPDFRVVTFTDATLEKVFVGPVE